MGRSERLPPDLSAQLFRRLGGAGRALLRPGAPRGRPRSRGGGRAAGGGFRLRRELGGAEGPMGPGPGWRPRGGRQDGPGAGTGAGTGTAAGAGCPLSAPRSSVLAV